EKSLRENIEIRVLGTLEVGAPDDHEVPGRVGRDGRPVLIVGGRRVHLELAAVGRAAARKPLREDTGAAAVRIAGPDDDELAARRRRYLRVCLRARLDKKLRSNECPGHRQALTEEFSDTVPDDHGGV